LHGILSGQSQTKKGNLRESTAGTELWQNSRVRPFGLVLQYSLENASSTLEDGAIENIDLAKLSM
jgi:hypothetical protein